MTTEDDLIRVIFDTARKSGITPADLSPTEVLSKLESLAKRTGREHALRVQCEQRFDHRLASSGVAAVAAAQLYAQLPFPHQRVISDLILWAQAVDARRLELEDAVRKIAPTIGSTHCPICGGPEANSASDEYRHELGCLIQRTMESLR